MLKITMGMSRGKFASILCIVFCFISSAYGAFTIDETFSTNDSFIIEQDEMNLTFFVLEDGLNYTTDNVCTVNGTPASFNSLTNEYNITLLNVTAINYNISCLNVSENKTPTFDLPVTGLANSEKKLMATVSNNFTFGSFVYYQPTYLNAARSIEPYSACSVDLEGSPFWFNTTSSVLHNVISSGPTLNFTATCNFTTVSDYMFNISFNSVAYEPQLELVESHFLENLTSTSGYRFGSYDYDLDGVEELYILSADGLSVYENEELLFQYPNIVMGSSSHFVISDMNFDGYGDILIGNLTDVEIINGSASNFTLPAVSVFSGTDVASFGVFDTDGDFLKDVLVVNGSGSLFDLNYVEDSDLTKKTFEVLQTNNPCDEVKIFDIDKNRAADIICLDTTSPQNIFFWTRNSSTSPLNDGFNKTLNYTPIDFYFTDINSDGDWELGVKSASRNYYYDNLTTTFDLLSVPSKDYGATANYEHIGSDIMLEELNSEIDLALSNPNSTINFLFNNSIANKDFNYPVASYLFSNRGIGSYKTSLSPSPHLLIGDFYSEGIVRYFNNTIDQYREIDLTHSSTIIPNSGTTNINFTVDINTTWSNKNYLLLIDYPATGKKYRNDIFDSQLNMKYHIVDESDSYEFNFLNSLKYNITIQPNKYSNILANQVSLSYNPPGCSCPFNQTGACFISTYCEVSDNITTAQNITLSNQLGNDRFEWTNIVSNAYITILNSSSDVFTNFIFANNTFVMENAAAQSSFIDSTFSNASVLFNLTNVSLENVSLSNTTLNIRNSSIVINNSDITINASNSELFVYNSTITNTTSFSGSTVHYYNCTTISFIDDEGSAVSLDYTIKSNDSEFIDIDSTGSSISNCFEVAQNQTQYEYTIEFDGDFEYFEYETNYTHFEPTQSIIVTQTNIPTWDYSVNGTHMTNFENYTLLQNVSNLSDVEISIGNGLNVTILDTANYSDVDLTSFVSRTGNDTVVLNTTFTNHITLALNYTPSRRVVVLPDYTLASISANVSTVNVTGSGTYQFASDLNFSHDMPSTIFNNSPINITINFTNYNGSIVVDASANCSIYNGAGFVSQTNAQFRSDVTLNISCSDSVLGTVSENVSVTVVNQQVSGYAAAKTFDTFALLYKSVDITNPSTQCANVSLLGYGAANYTGDYCAWNVSYVTSLNDVNITSPIYDDYNTTITVSVGRVYFDVTEIFGLFTQLNLTTHYRTITSNKFIADYKLNDSINLFSSSIESNLNKTGTAEIFYFKGDIFSNKEEIEIVN